MRTLNIHALVFCLVIALAGCGRGSKESNQFGDDPDEQDNATTSIPPTSPPVTPTPAPTVAPTPTPVPSNNWSQTGGPIGTVAQDGWSQFNGWPYNQGYPQNYQQPSNQQFPNYHFNYNNGYYIAALTSLYRSVLGRNPDLPGLQFWMRELIAGRPFTVVREEFLRSPEVTAIGNVAHVQDVVALYRVYFGRLPERGGLQFHVAQLTSGVPLSQVAANFRQSPEYLQFGGYGQSLFSRAVVDLFKNHLGRFGQYNELVGWLQNIAGGASYTAAINTFRATPEASAIGGLNGENCIALHRILKGKIPTRSEITRCTSKGNNTTGTPYNPALQAYARELMAIGVVPFDY